VIVSKVYICFASRTPKRGKNESFVAKSRGRSLARRPEEKRRTILRDRK
jgi:hypothetical protein